MIRTAVILAVLLYPQASVQAIDKEKDATIALERTLHGAWKGPACGGDWIVQSDGTFEVRRYTPGNNILTGTWEVRWGSLPPTLVWSIKTSDAPDRLPAGRSWEVKIVQLDDETLALQHPGHGKEQEHVIHYSRVTRSNALMRKLHSEWQGGPGVGKLILYAEGRFERQHYSPGNNRLSGTWEVRWNALPLTLVFNCEDSDNKECVGTTEVKLIEIGDEGLVYQFPGENPVRYERIKR
jgi:inhibitor of cysteine peptidase